MDLGIEGKVALVTGGSRGLGRQCALSLAAEGVNVAICGRTEETLGRTAGEIEQLGVRSVAVVVDVSDASALEPLHKQVVDGMGPIDILVNNVGGSRSRGGILETSPADFKGTFDLNLFGGFQLMQMVIPHMRAQRWGRIVNIATISGRELFKDGNISTMSSKAALIAATKHAAVSLAKDGILVNSVAPGAVLHPGGGWERFHRENSPEAVQSFIDQNLPLGRFGWPEPVGDLVAFLASERAALITGACVVIDGGQGYSML